MNEFTQKSQCRMLSLVKHFGDRNDSGTPCGMCDFCLPSAAKHFSNRNLTSFEKQIVTQIIAILEANDNRAVGRIYQELTEAEGSLTRSEFEKLLKTLARSRWIEISEESFQKENEVITYRKVTLLHAGKKATAKELSHLEYHESQLATVLKTKSPKRSTKTRKPSRLRKKKLFK
jgi:superfamily II DNA helicase RecQ